MTADVASLTSWIAAEEAAWNARSPMGRPPGKSPRAPCRVCDKDCAVRLDGKTGRHRNPRTRQPCSGSGTSPLRSPWPVDEALPGPPIYLTVALIAHGGISVSCQADGSGISGKLGTMGAWLPPWLAGHVHEERR